MRRARSRHFAEPLERRMLLSISPVGPEFRVNSYTSDLQTLASVAMDGDGDFVIAWESAGTVGQDGSGYGVFAQRYNAAGVPQGSEFQVNTYTTGAQKYSSVAIDADGDFVISWSSSGQDGDGFGVYAQRYNGVGVRQGSEFRVNTYTTNWQTGSSIAMDAAGNFVITWDSVQDGSLEGIYAQRYDAAGVPQGGEFRVNTYTALVQLEPSAAMDDDGDFVISWSSLGQDGSAYGVYAQRYNASGVPQGAEFRVNTFTTDTEAFGSAAMDANGDFVIAWNSFAQDGSTTGVYAQRFNAAGIPQGGEFRANTHTTNSQTAASAAMDADGDFVITWSSYGQDGSHFGAYAQNYNAAGAPQGGEFRANSSTTNAQRYSVAAMDDDGDFVIAWSSNGQDGSGYGVYAQRYDESTDLAPPVVGGVFVNGERVAPYTVHSPSLDQIVVSFSENVSAAGGSTGTNSVTNPANWLLTRNGADVTASISSITYGLNVTTNRYEAMLNLSASYATGNFLLMARDNIRDLAGNQLDGNLDGTSGGNMLLPFSIATAGASGPEFRVNSYTTSGQLRSSIAMDASGDFVVAWESDGQDGSGKGIYAQRFDPAGMPQGSEFRVNTYTTGAQRFPSTAMDADGNFVITWGSSGQDGSGYGVYAQRYTAAGVAQGSEFQVNTYTTSTQSSPSIAADADGDFIVTWHSSGQDGSGFGIYAQRYTEAGVPQGVEFRVNTETFDDQQSGSIALDADGDFVVAWSSGQDGSLFGVYAQRYDAAGFPQGSEFRVNTYTTDSQAEPSVAMQADGDFVVAWQSYGQDGSHYGIYVKRYDAAGVPQGGEFRVNTYTTSVQGAVSVATNADGNLVFTWQSFEQDGSSYSVHAQAFSAAGVAQGGEFQVNTYTTNFQFAPTVAVHADGHFVITWTSIGQDGSSYGVYARRYSASAPVVGTLSDAPDPVSAGNTLTLDASDVTDDGVVTSVSFYRESNGQPGLQVGFQGDTLVGTDTTEVGGIWSVNVSTTGLTAGTYTYWAQATDDAGLTGAPASTTNTIIVSTAPTVSASSFNYLKLPHSVAFTFDQNVSASLGTDDIVLENLTTMQTIPSGHLSLIYQTFDNRATFLYTGPGAEITSVLPDGNYRATLIAAGITNPGGTPMAANHVFNFFFLNGDANHDARVNLLDFNILAANFGQNNRDFSQGDFNYDTIVNLADFNILASRFGQVLAAPSSASAGLGGRTTSFGESQIRDEPDEVEELLS